MPCHVDTSRELLQDYHRRVEEILEAVLRGDLAHDAARQHYGEASADLAAGVRRFASPLGMIFFSNNQAWVVTEEGKRMESRGVANSLRP